ncbi:ATP-binding protein [Bosea sp. (in: a-proteobacteria)]|uniref:ATP-binding protein n=1 Tax=Bosea sp. (in: a-proteobacteria) TaxID=1871050 RepID=UPI0025BDE1EA|nr:ATP-binding protein [Bosea sp. (in: a-proteobacteria)]
MSMQFQHILEAPADDATDFRTRHASDAVRARRVAALEKVHRSYLKTDRDSVLEAEFDRLIDTSSLVFNGRRAEGRALVVVGQSGAGKTHAIRRLIEGRRELLPENLTLGMSLPIVSITAPSPCTLKQLGIELLRLLGYPIDRDVRENVAWNRVREQLRLRKVQIVHIDEAQHAVRLMNDHEIQKLSDTFKNVMQQPDWPVCLVLSGLPSLVQFAQRDVQFGRRCRFLSFDGISFPRDIKRLRYIVEAISTKCAALPSEGLESDEFLARLCRAAEGQFGRVIQICRSAAEEAIFAGAHTLTVRHFVDVYAAATGCSPDANVFAVRDWEFVPTGVSGIAAPLDGEEGGSTEPKRRKGRG